MEKIIIALISICCLVNQNSMELKENVDTPVAPVINENVNEFSNAEKVEIEPIKVTIKAPTMNINAVYPAARSFKSKEFENHINKSIVNNFSSYRNEIEQIVDDYTLDGKMYSYTVNYERNNCKDYLSLVISHDYQTGGVRSNTWKEIYNIDVLEEQILYLEDIFDVTADYKTAIITEIAKQAKEKGIVLMKNDGLQELSRRQKFYIRDDKLIIYFDPSEIAENKYGLLEFEMPFEMDVDGYFKIK